MDREQFSVLHDHYKESFALIREREKQRDMSFLVIIALVGALFVAVDYPNLIAITLKASTEVDFSDLPIVVVMSAIWTVLLTVVLRYCQGTVWIDRQYDYLHSLEAEISHQLGNPILYRREGKVYNDNYPLVSQWAWFLYTLLFPGIMVCCVIGLLVLEWSNSGTRWTYKAYDTAMGVAVAATFLMYKVPPLIAHVRILLTKRPRALSDPAIGTDVLDNPTMGMISTLGAKHPGSGPRQKG